MIDPVSWSPAEIVATRDLAPDVRLIEIAPAVPDGAASPGSHLQVVVPVGDRTDVRSYSVVETTPEGAWRIAVKRMPHSRGGSAYMWRLAPGARLTVSRPRNHFELAVDRPAHLLIAGGIGVTPIYAMARALAAGGATLRMLYGVRAETDLVFADDLRARLGDRLAIFVGERGERMDLDAEIARLPPGGEAYVCGPIGLLEEAREAWARSGRPASQFRFETFGASGRHPTRAFTVAIPRLGREIEVGADETLLDALERNGVEMIHDCRRGECGLCALPILSVDGVVDHRDLFFSPEEHAANARLCTCVSRVAGGRITIDTPDRDRPGI